MSHGTAVDVVLVYGEQAAGDVARRPAGRALVALDGEAHACLNELGVTHATDDDFLTRETLTGVRATARRLAALWRDAPAAVPELQHDGVSLPALLEPELFYEYAAMLVAEELAHGLVKAVQPQHVEVAGRGPDGAGAGALVAALERRGVRVTTSSPGDAAMWGPRVLLQAGGRAVARGAGFVDAMRALAEASPVAVLTMRGWIPEILRPVVDELERRMGRPVLRLCEQRDARACWPLGTGRAVVPAAWGRRGAGPARYASAWRTVRDAGAFRAAFVDHRGQTVWDVVEPGLRDLYERRFPHVAAHVTGSAALARRGTRVLLANTEWPAVIRAWMRGGQQARATTVCVLNSPPAKAPWLAAPPLADITTLYGPGSVEQLAALGVVPPQSVLTGHPVFDRLLADATRPTRGDLGIPPDRRVVLFEPENYVERERVLIWQPTVRTRRDVVGDVVAAARGVNGAWLLVAPQPNDRSVALLRSCLPAGADARVVHGGDPAAMLPLCDVAVVHDSLLGVQAMVLGTPVIAFNPAGLPATMGFVTAGAALPASSAAELGEALRVLLHDPARRAAQIQRGRDFARHYAGEVDGKAAVRIADLVEQLAA